MGGNGLFGFTVTGPSGGSASVTTTGTVLSGTGTTGAVSVTGGTYGVIEVSTPTGFSTVVGSCTVNGSPVADPTSFVISAGDVAVCTFTNTKNVDDDDDDDDDDYDGKDYMNIALVCDTSKCIDKQRDVPLKNHLKGLEDTEVTTYNDNNKSWNPNSYDVVVISESSTSAKTAWLKNKQVGILTLDGANWDELDLGNRGSSEGGGSKKIVITDNTHYITSGFKLGSVVTVTTPSSHLGYIAGWDAGSSQVLKLAHHTGNGAQKAKILVAGEGDILVDGSTAAGKRVFFGVQYFDNLTDDGKKLFNNALEWASEYVG